MSESLGTFSAPGAGTVDVLGIELTHDFNSGTLEGVARLAKRPYWEGTLTPCVVEMPAAHDRAAQRMTGFWVGRGVYDGEGCNVNITGMQVQPATPTLDEPTAPADVDWSEIRSATEARDWRRAWQAVGTDHAGDATPGETYLLSKAARAKATAAALVAWRKVEMDAGTIFIGADAHRVWERIKHIAGWTSQARAQYKPRPKSAKQTRTEWLNQHIRPGAIQIPDDILGGRYSAVNVGDFVVADDVESFEQALALSLVDYRAADEDTAMTRGNGGITSTVTIPPSTSRSIVAMLATQARLTGGARLHIGTEDESITITPSSDVTRWQRPDPAAATSHVGIATHATNPNPRGPHPRRRSRT